MVSVNVSVAPLTVSEGASFVAVTTTLTVSAELAPKATYFSVAVVLVAVVGSNLAVSIDMSDSTPAEV